MKNKLLFILKDCTDYISGEELAKNLNVTRSYVWKIIKNLKIDGYEIKSKLNKGYKLIKNFDIIDEEKIKVGIQNTLFENKILYYNTLDSTNDTAKKLALNGCKEGFVVICDNQLNGKGRLGRKWICEKNQGIFMSFIIKPNIGAIEISKITLLVSLAVSMTLEQILDFDVLIKWPNDIVVNNKKICGILLELSAEIDKVNFLVAGIGINIYNKNFDEDLQNKATSLFLENCKNLDRTHIITNILKYFDSLYKRFMNSNFSEILQEYKKRCISLKKDVQIITQNSIKYGYVEDIDNSGHLIVLLKNGVYETIFSGEVSLRISDNSYL